MPTFEEINQSAIEAKKQWHQEQRFLPVEEKMRILLQMQINNLPLIERQRPLKPHERPWPVDP